MQIGNQSSWQIKLKVSEDHPEDMTKVVCSKPSARALQTLRYLGVVTDWCAAAALE